MRSQWNKLFPSKGMNFFSFLLILGILISHPCTSFAQTTPTELLAAAQQAFNDGFSDVASRYLREFLQSYPQSLKRNEAKLLLGQCDFMQGNYKQALDLFNELSRKPDNKDEVFFWRAETYLKQNRLLLAQDDYKKVIHDYPKSLYAPQAYYSLGWSFFEEKKFDEAQAVFKQLVSQFPKSPLIEDVKLKIADCAYNAGRFKEAVEGFKRWLSLYPHSPYACEAHLNLADSFYYQQQPEAAFVYYQKVASGPCEDTLKLSGYVGEVYSRMKSKKMAEARNIVKRAEEFCKHHQLKSPDLDLARANLAYEQASWDKALALFSDFIASWPQSDHWQQGYLGRANVYYLLGKYKEAQQDYNHLLYQTDFDTFTKVRFGLGWCAFKMGQLPQALGFFQTVFDKATQVDVKESSLIQMADINQEAGHWLEAVSAYEKVKKDFAGGPMLDYVLYRQAIAFLKLGNWPSALLNFGRLKTEFPHSPYLEDMDYYNGVISFKRNDWAQSIDYMEHFLKHLTHLSTFGPEANYILALAHLNLNQPEEALSVFEKILRLYPNQPDIAQNADIGIAKCEFKMGQYKEAIKRFKLIVFKYPKSDAEFEALLWLAQYYLKNADIDAAINFYKSIIVEFPDSPRLDQVHYELGQAFEIQGFLDSALEQYKAISSTNRHLMGKARLSVAGILSKDLDPHRAIAAYESIMVTNPDVAGEAYLKLGQLYRNLQDYEKEIDVYQYALSHPSGTIDRAQVQFNLADSLELMSRTKEAIAEYLKIPLLYPNELSWVVKAYLRIAKIYEEDKDWQEARLTYQKIIQLKAPEAAYAEERLERIKSNAWKMGVL